MIANTHTHTHTHTYTHTHTHTSARVGSFSFRETFTGKFCTVT